MVQLNNQISLYSKLTEELIEKANIMINTPLYSFNNIDEEIDIELDEEYSGTFNINKYNSDWIPTIHNLRLIQSFDIEKPYYLYGADGLTMPKNLIGLAVQIHSKKSNFQKTKSIGFIPNSEEAIHLDFEEEFAAGTLRGEIHIEYFLYLAEIEEFNSIQASKIGMLLSDYFNETLIIVDGDGSEFPMSEFNEKDGPLWRLHQNWIDPSVDIFDISNINLQLNVGHPLFGQIQAGKTKISRMMMIDIMVQAMSLIIQEVYISGDYREEEIEGAPSNSILGAVNYWVSTYEVDTTSNTEISNSIRTYWHRLLSRGEI